MSTFSKATLVKFLIITIFLLPMAGLQSANVFANNTTYYVSTSGDDNNSGTGMTQPWKTLSKVSGITFQPGDKILLKCGNTWNNETLVLHGSGNSSSVIELGSYGTGNKPTIINNTSTDVIAGTNLSFWLIHNLKIGLTTTVPIDQVPVGSADNEEIGISLTYDGAGPYYGMQIRGNEIYGASIDNKTSGILVTAKYQIRSTLVLQGLYMTDNYIHDIGIRAIHTAGWNGSTNLLSTQLFKDVYIEGNTVYSFGCQGIILGMANNAFIRWNKVSYGGQSGINIGWGPAGIWPIEVDTAQIKFNEVSNQDTNGFNNGVRYDGEGIELDWDTQNILLQYNYVHDNVGAGLGTMANLNNKMYNNKVSGNQGLSTLGAGQIAVSDFTNGTMYGVNGLDIQNNLIIVNTTNTKALTTTNISPGGIWNNNNFSNNNIVMGSSTGNLVYGINNNTNLTTVDNNGIYSSSGNWFGAWRNGTYYWVLPAWRTATGGYDNNSSTYYSETVVPTSPAHLDASGNLANNTVSLSWSASSDSNSGISHYNIYRSTVSGFTPSYMNMFGEAAGTTFVDNIYVTPNTTYYYKIEAEDKNGNVSPAVQISVNKWSYLSNMGFENDAQLTQTPVGWNTWTDNNSADADYTNNYQPYSGNYRLEHYRATAYRVFTYQTPTGLVNGLYTIKARVASSGGQNSCQMQIKNYGGADIYTNITGGAWNQIVVTNVNVTNGQILIGFWSDANDYNWITVDDVELIKQ